MRIFYPKSRSRFWTRTNGFDNELIELVQAGGFMQASAVTIYQDKLFLMASQSLLGLRERLAQLQRIGGRTP